MKKNQKILIGTVVGITAIAAFIYVSKDILTSRAGSGLEVEETTKGVKPLNMAELKSTNVCRKIYLKAEPEYNDETIAKRVLRLCREPYAAHYDPMVKMPLNVTYNIKWIDLKDRTIMPPPVATKDPDFPIKEIPTADDYLTTGYYAQTHLTDYRDFVKNSNDKWTDKQYIAVNQRMHKQAGYSSITFPVVKYNFIDGIWEDLNRKTYKDLEEFKYLTVVVGPVFHKGQTLGVLGENKIPVPTHFYKIVYNEKKRGASVYVFPNKEIVTAKTTAIHNPENVHYCRTETGAAKYCEPNDFLVKFRDLETITGQTFFPNLTARAALRVKQDIKEVIERKQERPTVPVPEK